MRIHTLLVSGVLLLLSSAAVNAQEEEPEPATSSSTFDLTGTSSVETQYADQQGVGQDLPSRYTRWQLTPTVILFDIPFTGSLLLSTEQSRGRQSINSFNLSFSLDQDQLQERLRQRLIERVASAAFGGTIEDMESFASVEEALNDPSRIADIDRLQAKVESGVATTEEAEELRTKQTELESLREKYETLKGIKEKVGDAEDLKDMAETRFPSEDLYNPDNLRGALTELDMLSGVERFLYNFPRFGIGVNYPYYSPYTINGIAVNGADIIFNPGKFYLATTVGTAQRDVPEALANDSTYIAFDRTIYAGRIGYGKLGEGHALLTVMYAGDQDSSVIVDTATGFYLAPQENWVLGLEVDIPIVPEVFMIKGEIAGSLLSGDLSSPEVETSASLDAPSWLSDLVKFRTSSFFDYSLSVEPRLTITTTGTKLKGSFERIGPGYVTLGIPYLRNDLIRFEGELEQKLIKKQVTLSGRYRKETDNLIDWKRATTELQMFSVGLGLNFRRLPFLRLNYTPYRQTNDAVGEFQVDNKITVITAVAGHRYPLGGTVSGMTTASFTTNDVKTLGNRFDSETKVYSLGQSFSIGSWLNLQANGSLSQPRSVIDTLRDNMTLDIGASVTFLEDWNGTLGGTLFTEESESSKVGYYAGLFIPIKPIGSQLEIRAEKNVYDATNPTLTGIQDYDETILRASLWTEW
ncbi:MAG: hypothetical protein AB7H80_08130 [Candidatus Kapaibacterium sp.]